MTAPSGDRELTDRLAAVAFDHRCAAWGATSAEPWPEVAALLQARRDAGLAATMQFTYRNPTRSTDATRIIRNAASIFVVAMPVAANDAGRRADAPAVAGRAAAYASGDARGALLECLDDLRSTVRQADGRAAVVSDSNALVDREAAVRAGLGWYGRNCNVLVPGAGSWVLLGSIVTDRHLVEGSPMPDGCGTCRRCLVACPTGALIAPGVLDARRCLAWVVQAPGSIPLDLRAAVGDRVYGCDDCQTCCPVQPAGQGRSETGPASRPSGLVDVLALWAKDDAALLGECAEWYVAERDVRHIRRTLLIVMGNVADPCDTTVIDLLGSVADGDDGLLAEHAAWALQRLEERRPRSTPGGAPGSL